MPLPPPVPATPQRPAKCLSLYSFLRGGGGGLRQLYQRPLPQVLGDSVMPVLGLE